ncbi:MAG: NAD(P)-dependent oxidoreductase [Parcubacteria group bacterium]|nr:NAD(P)-dependent oxidoreductase [Parcubacteria group bacterium]
MSNILLTGGSGYIGSVLTEELLKKGHRVRVLDNFMHGQTSLAHLMHSSDLEVVRGDTRNEGTLKSALNGMEIIIPLAAILGAQVCDRDEIAAQTTNLGAVQSILKLRSPDQKILYPNTNSGYGVGQNDTFCDETTPLNPISLYGRTKVEAEKGILEGGNSITFRLATVFGVSPRMRIDLLVNDFVHRAVMDRFVVLFQAHFKRNYIHVRDVARAFVHGIDNFETMKGQAYNVGLSEANLSKKELCEAIQKHLPDFYFVEAEIGEDPDKRNYIVSNEKIEKTGFKPAYSLDFGITELIKFYRTIKRSPFGNI